ncbi:MAG: HEAT repeat domain-containing protein [Alphaproteobacteria bacterium]|uniref:HEAT repeat domain-containing protein n=1 Tax=Candidatus Nitrobium versatile TaxID=2884831 RepID=A0A953J634_9BACT|nr:HEAT repeat domain-containing protein [Candidatus Nitrobium versatile]
MVKNIKKIIQNLESDDPPARRRAAETLGEGDERAIYPLVKALNDENAGVQDAAMRALISIGGEVTAYMVLPLLRSNTLLRNTALIILKELGEVAVPLLYSLLKDKDDDVRKFAIDLFGEIKRGVDPSRVVPLLGDVNANVRAAAAKALGVLEYRAAVPELVHALGDEEWVAFSALEALGDLMAQEAAGEIAALLSSPSGVVRFVAIETLGRLKTASVLDALLEYLPRASEEEKNAVIKSLILIGITPEMADLSDYLIAMLKDGDWNDREIALKGMVALNCRKAVPYIVDIAGSLDPSVPGSEERISLLKSAINAIDAEEELLNLLESSDIKYRGKSFAIEILGETRSKRATFRLIDYLNDMRRDLRRATVEALGEIGDPEVIGHLLEASQRDVDAHVRRSAIEALGNIQAKEAYTPLVDLLAVERYYDVVEKIVEALLKIDTGSLLADLSRYNSNVREVAAKTICEVDILLQLADDTEKKVRMAAIYGLGRAGTQKAVAKLIHFLGDSDPDIRKTAVVGLGDARSCSAELFDALHDDDPWVRFYAIKAIAFSCDEEKAVFLISSMFDDEFIPVVMSAIDSIKQIGGREAYEALVAHEGHPNPDVQEKIREALHSL